MWNIYITVIQLWLLLFWKSVTNGGPWPRHNFVTELLLMDMGGTHAGICSDLSRPTSSRFISCLNMVTSVQAMSSWRGAFCQCNLLRRPEWSVWMSTAAARQHDHKFTWSLTVQRKSQNNQRFYFFLVCHFYWCRIPHTCSDWLSLHHGTQIFDTFLRVSLSC